LRMPCDIVACEQTSQLYVADSWFGGPCIWRVSTDGTHIQDWLPKSPFDTFHLESLSVTSSRLLITSCYPHHQLIQFNSVGDELKRVQLPDDMEPGHAVESPTGTFIVSRYHRELNRGEVVEVNDVGEVLRKFSGSRLASLGDTAHVAVDSRGNIFVADQRNHRILLLDNRLTLRRTIIDKHQLDGYRCSERLCYDEQSGQLLVLLMGSAIAVFDMLCS